MEGFHRKRVDPESRRHGGIAESEPRGGINMRGKMKEFHRKRVGPEARRLGGFAESEPSEGTPMRGKNEGISQEKGGFRVAVAGRIRRI